MRLFVNFVLQLLLLWITVTACYLIFDECVVMSVIQFFVVFSASTLIFGWLDDTWSMEKPVPLIHRGFLLNQADEGSRGTG